MQRLRLVWLFFFFLAGCGTIPQTTHLPAVENTPTPQSEDPVISELLPWTAEQADHLIQELTQSDQSKVETEPVIHQALLLAIQEALWSFPKAQQAAHWNWMQVSIQAHDGNSAAAQTAGKLMADAFQSGGTSLDDLTAWLHKLEPAGVFTQTLLTNSPGQPNVTLLEFYLTGQPAFYGITSSEDSYNVSLLASGREFQDSAGIHTRLEWQDLTGDGQAEAWIITLDQNRRIEMASLSLYDISSGSAQRIRFSPALPMLPDGSWQLLEQDGRSTGLKVGLRVDDGSALCEYLLPVEYRPEDSAYRRTAIEQPDLERLVAAGFSEAQARLCLDLSVDWFRANVNSGDLVSLQLLEQMMPGFPYGADATLYVGLYPPDEIDRARFELGLNYALRKDLTGVQRWMSAIIDQPAYAGSPWQAQAQSFLDAYQAERDLRSACLASQACFGNGRLDLNQLVGLMQAEDWSAPVIFLEQNGLTLMQSGTQDLNLDGMPETWWLESTGGATDTVRILARYQDQPWLNRLSLLAGTGALELESMEPLLGLPVYRIQYGTSESIFLYVQTDASQAPEVWTLDQYRAHMIQSLYTSLLQGGEVAEIVQSLETLRESPYFNCDQPGEICQPSAQLAYLSALSLERAGEPYAAAAAYQQVGEDFPESSYAILANARLAP